MRLTDRRDEVRHRGIHFLEHVDGELYILGTNEYGLCTARWLESLGHNIKGFINDYSGQSTFESYRVISSTEVPKGASIINCIVEARTRHAEQVIAQLCPASHADYFAMQRAFPEKLMEINYLEGTDSIADEVETYAALYDQLVDSESRSTFELIADFRFNRDIEQLNNFRFRIDEQYFEPFIPLSSTPGFVDGGAYRGETSRTFVGLYPHYRDIYLFEPNTSSFSVAKDALAGRERVHFYQKGLWDKSETLYFDNSRGNASKLSHEGKISIETVTLDSVIPGGVDFIKLDLEGAEYRALIGAESLIKRFRPVLAVCVYHDQKDFIRIPELLFSFDSSYKVYVRHYTQGVLETVMYFV